tara:strand:+ start:55732 stop:57141 length:1410 start_codon:yes stop_codon:yes gene_type:complete
MALLLCSAAMAQVGIGTTTPEPSSILDISSEEQGLLAPRMTTAQRNAITTPANSLLVYDTDLKSFYYFDSSTTSWVKMNAASSERDNFKLVKSAADLAPELTAGGGSTYLLDENTYYEINGTITLAAPIDLNNAYLSGLDANEDILFKASGTIFQGANGGSIRNVTLSGNGTAFSISGGTSLLVQNTIVANFSTVGSIAGLNIFFGNIIQFTGNTNGITYSNIDNLLLSNQGWFGNNSGTYETFTGDFDLIEKVSGFSIANGTAIAINVSGNPNVTDGVLFGTAFSGTSTMYINRYTSGSYTGFNFTKNWIVNCPGIPRESDDVATGNFYYSGSLTTGFTQSIASGTAVKIVGNGTTTANSLFRFSAPSTNNMTYEGKKTRNFQINAALSIRVIGAAGDFYAFVIAKNGTVVTESNAVVRINSDTDIQNVALNSIVSMAPTDFIEIYAQRLTGSGTDTLVVFSENLSIK